MLEGLTSTSAPPCAWIAGRNGIQPADQPDIPTNNTMATATLDLMIDLVEIRFSIWTLQIDSYEIQCLPDPFGQYVHVQTLLCGYGDEISSNLFLHYSKIVLVDEVYLVKDDECRSIPSVPS